MTDSPRRSVSHVSDAIHRRFNNVDSYLHYDFALAGHEITSNLPLQMSLYLNVIFFPFWLLTAFVMLYIKYDCLSNIYRFIVFLILTCITTVECIRLYLGYIGNLSEKVPELAGFWLVSVVLQVPLHLFLLFSLPIWPLPAEYATEAVMLFLLAVELCTGFTTLRKSARQQARLFHLHQLQHKEPTATDLDFRTPCTPKDTSESGGGAAAPAADPFLLTTISNEPKHE